MSKRIKSIFDNMDMAEFARMRLKREGVDIESYNVKRLNDRSEGDTDNTGIIINPVFDNGTTNEALWAGSNTYQPFGGILVGSNSFKNEHRVLKDDIYSDETGMTVTVPDNQVELAEDIIRSCHGHSITVE